VAVENHTTQRTNQQESYLIANTHEYIEMRNYYHQHNENEQRTEETKGLIRDN